MTFAFTTELLRQAAEGPDPVHTVTEYPSGTTAEEWKVDGVRSRLDGPAYLLRRGSAVLEYEWKVLGRHHRSGGDPAVGQFDDFGGALTKEWWVGGLPFRLDGPSRMDFYGDGRVRMEEFRSGDARRHLSIAEVAGALAERGPVEVGVAVAHSGLARLVEAGADPGLIVEALAAGVSPGEGLRLVLEGAPIEWVAAFEGGAS